jgi:hypothetical protein
VPIETRKPSLGGSRPRNHHRQIITDNQRLQASEVEPFHTMSMHSNCHGKHTHQNMHHTRGPLNLLGTASDHDRNDHYRTRLTPNKTSYTSTPICTSLESIYKYQMHIHICHDQPNIHSQGWASIHLQDTLHAGGTWSCFCGDISRNSSWLQVRNILSQHYLYTPRHN